MRHCFSRYSLYFAWLTVLTATLISLYFSAIQGMYVCELCWYQRICLYPLVIILGIATYREDKNIVRYVMPLTIIGFLFSLYQYLEQMVPGFSSISFCGSSNECAQINWSLWGFITLPLLSMIANLIIIFFLTLALRRVD